MPIAPIRRRRAGGAFEESLVFPITATLSGSAGFVTQGTVSLPATMTAVNSHTVTRSGVITLSSNAGSGWDTNRITNPNLSLAITLSTSNESMLDGQNNITLAATLSQVYNIDFEEALTLATTLSLITLGGFIANDSITIGVTASINWVDDVSKEESLILATTLSDVCASQVDAVNAVYLAISMGITNTGLLEIVEAVSLLATASSGWVVTKTSEDSLILSTTLTFAALEVLAGAVTHIPLKSLVLDLGGGIGQTLQQHGNTLSISILTETPTEAPPGDIGVVFLVTGGALKIYAWDGSQWVVNN